MDDHLWFKNCVFYETYADKFAGDFSNFKNKIGYLKDLGVDCVHVLPFFPSGGADDGYDVVDYTAVRPDLGTIQDFADFVAAAKRQGVRVIIDLVLNHTSIQHPWFKEAVASPDSPKRNYYLWSRTGKEFAEAYNPFSNFKPSNWIFDPTRNQYYYSSYLPAQADLNWDNPEVEREIHKIADFWLDLGVSGFRLDATSFLIKREGTSCRHLPETHAILKRLRKRIESKNPEAITLAEVHAPIDVISAYFGEGDECHMAYHFPLMQRMFLALARNNPDMVEDTIRASANIPENCQWATFLSCHDEISLSSVDAPERAEIISFLDPENKYPFKEGKSVSVRMATAFKGDREKISRAFRVLLGSPGSPVIYYGDEIGARNLELSEPPVDSRILLRGPFDWPLAEMVMKNQDSIYHAIKNLIRERKNK